MNYSTTIAGLLIAPFLAAQVSVVINRYDTLGTGANPRETILDSANVRPGVFGKLFSYAVQGAVFAQPLYLPGVGIPGKGVHNVIYIATMDDRIYAFDADRAGEPLWQRELGTPVPVSDVTGNNDLNIVGNVGILSTPVIDPATQTIYLVSRSKEKPGYVQRIHALDVSSGQDRVPAAIIHARIESQANDALEGYLSFNAKTNNQRAALILTNGQVVIAWASHEDILPYHGWIMAYDAKTLHQTAVFCVTPAGMAGGIWQSGRAPAVDSAGNIYLETGNGDWNGTTDFGETLLKLRLHASQFVVADYYTPADYPELNRRDADFGSTGPFLIPAFLPGSPGLIVCGDKHGVLTLLNSQDLGKLHAGPSQLIQQVPVNGGRVLNGPAWWNNTLYLWGEADVLKAFHFNGATVDVTPVAKGATASHGSPGGALTVSADGTKPGSAIVWALLGIDKSADHGNAPGVLRAYHAETLEALWNSEQNAERDRLGTLVKFVPPTVVNGKVYAATYDGQVQVYGVYGATAQTFGKK
jgi:hypothetical protein